MEKLEIPTKLAKEIIADHWNSWHRFASEDDDEFMHPYENLVSKIEERTGETFNYQGGRWED